MVHLRTQHFCEYIRVRMEIRRGGVEGKKMQERVPLTIFNDIALTECIRIVFHAYASLPISPLFLLIISRVLEKEKEIECTRYRWNIQRFPAILFIKSVYKLLPTSHVTFFFFLFETQCKYSLLLSVQITLRCSARVQVFLSEEKYALHFCSFRLQRCNLTFINVFP